MTNLTVGKMYRIKDTVPLKVCDRAMQYLGQEEYNGATYHTFWDSKMRLKHWINPDNVEEVK